MTRIRLNLQWKFRFNESVQKLFRHGKRYVMPKSLFQENLHYAGPTCSFSDLGSHYTLLCPADLKALDLKNCLHELTQISQTKPQKLKLEWDLSQVQHVDRSMRNMIVDLISYHQFQFFSAVHIKGNLGIHQLFQLLRLSFPQNTQHFFAWDSSGPKPYEVELKPKNEEITASLQKQSPHLMQALGDIIWADGICEHNLIYDPSDVLAPFYSALNLVGADFHANRAELIASQDQLRHLELNHSQIMNSVGTGIQITRGKEIVFVNDALCEMLSMDKSQLLALEFLDYIHENDREDLAKSIQLLLGGKSAPPTLELRLSQSKAFETWIEVRPRLIYFQGQRSVLYSISDITGRKLAEKKIRRMAFHDALTGLPNRILLEDRVETAIRRCRRNNGQLALIFIDLDRFKIINDSLGHHAGDRLLVETARRLSQVVRATDTVSRYGGDEFVVLIPEVDNTQGLKIVLDKIQNALAQPMKLQDDKEIVITPSMGVSLYPEHGNTFEMLMQKSDMAMYQAKDNGRNTYAFFDRSQNILNEDRLDIESQIRKALEEKQFILHYQPQIDLKTKQVIGFEALIRWMHPKQGLIPPYQFITIAEESGLIEPMGLWVLEEACRQNKAWQDAGLPPVQMGVNISPRQFSRSNLIQSIERTLSQTGLDHKYLKVEITESAIMSNVGQNIETLRKIQDLGVSISVDDFGTGYSSLNYLKKFPISILKIDQSFVRDMTEDANDAAIVRAIIAMGTQLQLELVAEGVETEAQLRTLYDMGCSTVQGYLFAKPLPAFEAEKFLRAFEEEGHPAL